MPFLELIIITTLLLVLGGTSWEEEALLGLRWRPRAHAHGEDGEELVDSEIRGSSLTAEQVRISIFHLLHAPVSSLLFHLAHVLHY